MNDYDSGRIADLLNAEMGYERTDVLEEADLVVVNTCSIREKAQEKTFSDLGRIREVKKTRPGMLIAVGGCVASQEGENVIRRAPCVDVVFGPQTLHRLPDMLRARVETGRPPGRRELPRNREVRSSARPEGAWRRRLRLDHGRLLEVLLLLRGALHPRRGDLAPDGGRPHGGRPACRSGRQGSDASRPERERLSRQDADGSIADFALLLDYVSEIDGIERIRYTTSHPREFSQRIIDAYGRLPKLVNHVHLPRAGGLRPACSPP